MKGVVEVAISADGDGWRVVLRVSNAEDCLEVQGQSIFKTRAHAAHHAEQLTRILTVTIGEESCTCMEGPS